MIHTKRIIFSNTFSIYFLMKILLITKIKERLNGKENEKEFELWSAHKDI